MSAPTFVIIETDKETTTVIFSGLTRQERQLQLLAWLRKLVGQ